MNIETIRYYEKIGIMPAPARSAAGYRIYGVEACQGGCISFVGVENRLQASTDCVTCSAWLTGTPSPVRRSTR